MKILKDHFSGLAAVGICLLAGLALFGTTGFLTVAVFFAFFLVPAYAIIYKFSLEPDERFFFSIFISLGVFPIIIWYFNKVIPSFRAAAIAVALLLMASGASWFLVSRFHFSRKSRVQDKK